MYLKASCFAVKQQFYGHFLATRIFHLATEKKISVDTWRSQKKVNFGPWVSLVLVTFLINSMCLYDITCRQILILLTLLRSLHVSRIFSHFSAYQSVSKVLVFATFSISYM